MDNKYFNFYFLTLLVVSSNTFAQEDKSSETANQNSTVEEVIVTATKRAENLQNVPVAVTVFNPQVIQEAGINDLSDIARMTPSTHITNTRHPFQTRLAIRGIGTSQNDPALEPSVGIFVDGISLGRTGLGTSDLADIARIEVLQGPQGTLYGKNTNAGVINIITKKPNAEENEGYVELSLGDYGLRKYKFTSSGPLTDKAAYRFTQNFNLRDGYFKNSNGPNSSDEDTSNFQFKLYVQPSDKLSYIFSASDVRRNTAGGGFDITPGAAVQAELANQGLPLNDTDPYNFRVSTSLDSLFEMDSEHLSLSVNYDMENGGALTSLTSYSDYEYFVQNDPDGSQLDILTMGTPERNGGNSFTQEIRLDADINDSTYYQVGLYYEDRSTSRSGDSIVAIGRDAAAITGPAYLGAAATLPIPSIGLYPLFTFAGKPGDYMSGYNVWDSETLAAFGQITWNVNDNMRITAGGRWSDEKKDASLLTEINSAPLTAREQQIRGLVMSNPRIPMAVKGFINTPFLARLATPIDEDFARESKNNDWLLKAAYDFDDNIMLYASAGTGTKSGNFNGVNGPAISREFKDEHTTSYELGVKSILLDSTLRINAAAFLTEVEDLQFQSQIADSGSAVSNAAEAEASGIDLAIQSKPIEGLTLDLGVLYLDTYDNIRPALEEGDVESVSALPFASKWAGNFATTFAVPYANGILYTRADYIYRSEHALLNGEDHRREINARVGWRNDKFNISAWGKNLNDDQYASNINGLQKWSGNQAYLLAPPRTYGVEVRYSF